MLPTISLKLNSIFHAQGRHHKCVPVLYHKERILLAGPLFVAQLEMIHCVYGRIMEAVLVEADSRDQ